MIRSYSLVVFDSQDRIVDRIDLPITTNPTENGFKLALSTVSSDIEDIITKVVQQKIVKKFNVIHHDNSYQKARILTNWIQKYSTPAYRMALEYNDTVSTLYCEGRVTSLGKTEKDEFGLLTQPLEFTPITPYFTKIQNTITIQRSAEGKAYPYKYPYMYGSSLVENNTIDNPYIFEIPIIIKIDGAIDTPTINLLDEDGNSYTQVRFSGISLVEGESLVINSAQRKIYKINLLGEEEDYAPEVDPRYDTFLRAKSGTSSITVNLSDSGSGFKLTGGWRQYTL